MIDMSKIGEMMSSFQEKAKELESQNENVIHTAKSGGGLVEVSANGKGEVIDIKIDDSLMEDKESMQILLISAVNDVIKNVDEGRKQMAMNVLGDMSSFAPKE